MTIFYESSIDDYILLGSDHAEFIHRYKNLTSFFRYYFTPKMIAFHFKNLRHNNKKAKNILIKVYSVHGNIYDDKNYVLERVIKEDDTK